ncbi:MAG TPA: glycosyltransferase [Pyrinomonadaceae bacterium]
MTPKVSVLMAVYNGERYLREAIDSILGQTFADFEFIIIDDASTDRSFEIAGGYADPRIRLVRNERNLGLTLSLNRGLDLARGEYVARMDCDDLSLPERLAKQVAFMEANPDVGACSTWAFDIDSAGNVIGKRELPVGEQLDNFYWRRSLIHPAAMFRFDRSAGPRYDPAFRYAQDYDLWFRIRAERRLCNLPEHLLLYRVHEESITGSRFEAQLRACYDVFCRNTGTRAISFEAYLALTERSWALHPLRRAFAMMRLARRLRTPYRVYFRDDLRYARVWMYSRQIYNAVARTRTYRVARDVLKRIARAGSRATGIAGVH